MLIILLSYLGCLFVLLWPAAAWQQQAYFSLCRYGLFYGFLLLLGSQGHASKVGLVLNAFLPLALYGRKARATPLRLGSQIASIAIPLLSATWPDLGFNRVLVWGPQALYEYGREFALTLSLPKMILVLACCAAIPLHHKLRWQWSSFMAAWIVAIALVGLAYTLGIPLQMKWGLYLPWFFLVNLCITVLAEEIFFRLLVQDTLAHWLSGRLAKWIAALIAGLLFYLVHGFTLPQHPVAWIYLTASLSYAFFYARYHNLLASVTLHFTVNALHIVLLAYPLA